MKHVLWTQEAEDSFYEIVDYLNENWTEREYLNFESETHGIIAIITKHPYIYPATDHDKNVRKAVMMKLISVYYRVDDHKVTLLLFWNNTRNPESLNL